MVNVKKQIKGNQTYYYLEHSIRKGKKIQKKQKYLGKELPKNLEDLKKEFASELYKDKWLRGIDSLNHSLNLQKKNKNRHLLLNSLTTLKE